MTEKAAATTTEAADGAQDEALEAGNYEVIRARLLEQGRELSRRAEALNRARKETFGGTELQVIANPRIRTANNSVPRDIVQVGGVLLFGYEVFIGLKSETTIGDVFALHKFDKQESGSFDCSAVELAAASGFLQDPQFIKEFAALYKFTRDAKLLRLMRTDQHLFAVFQIGSEYTDNKTFRWRIEGDGTIVYVDDRGERSADFHPPPSHAFEWQLPEVEWQVEGRHIRIEDKVFVSNLDKQLTLRVEDNTAQGRRVWSESIEDRNQQLSDLRLRYALVGPLVLLELQPFREQTRRYVVFNTKTQAAERIDAIGLACQELPEDHGIIFPGGYFLTTGDHKVFEHEAADLTFVRCLRSPNGEDVLYVFHRARDGHYVLFPYNLIRKEVQTPIHCHGYSLFADGLLVVFRAMSDEPTRVHPMQVWDTPFTSAEHAAAAPTDDSFLANVGNAELVRGISDAFSIVRLISDAEPTRQIFEDLIANTARTLDAYYWLDNKEVGDLRSTLSKVRETAELIVDEFDKVLAFRTQAATELKATEERYQQLADNLRTEHFKKVDPFLEGLTSLRSLRGHIITLRDTRYIDRQRLDELEELTKTRFDEVSKDCVAFLLRQEALEPLTADLAATLEQLDGVQKVADVTPLKDKVDSTAEGLDLLSEVVANLQIEDATQRTRILTGIGEVFGNLNRVRATIEGRRKELLSAEGKAEFAAQFALLGQSVSSALALCDTPEKCDEQLSRLMVQLEELEGRFSEFDEFLADLATKREEIYEAFGTKKQQLLDERQRRVQNLAGAAERIIEGVGRRAAAMKSNDELNAYFASDAMVMKVRQLCEQLVELGDTVKSDSFLAMLKGARQDALRGLRDKLELFDEGDLIKFGRHRFSVNRQKLEMSMVPRGDRMALHLSGTDFYELVADEAFDATARFWSQTLISENASVYRGEYLAACIIADAEEGSHDLSVAKLHEHLRDGTLGELTRAYAQNRYDEGYDRGLHDDDAARIVEKLINLREAAGLLRYAPPPRALALLFWVWHDDDDAKKRWHLQVTSLGRLRSSLGHSNAIVSLAQELSGAMAAFVEREGLALLDLFTDADLRVAGEYLAEELVDEQPHFATSSDAKLLVESLLRHIDLHGDRRAFDGDMRALDGQLREKLHLARAWVQAYIASTPEHAGKDYLVIEAAALLCDKGIDREPSSALTDVQVTGLLGQHKRIEGGKMTLRIDEFLSRLEGFRHREVPAFRAYRKLRHDVIERERKRLRLEEFIPKVMTAFVRNKLINDVYLPLIGDNLAKQIGAAGEGKRTDLMGLLLLISPPGYGKTTLMEYIANRLGLVFVKVNGPSLGHAVVSLDPSEAPNATARQEVEKINLAFEMGNNVMLYLDDIQHTHSELLQKFISLCDAQRRIEGVWQGNTRTYDMRGKKFCVVMAGNPYTESGDKFQIPDMLANRADTYNLGDILQGKDDAFALSYIENALTSNPALQPLATREQSDVYKLIRMARGEEIATTELSHGYSAVEVSEIKKVLSHMFRAQAALLMVNQMYIESASQDDKFRTEPPFKLQGSYRNMNRLAEKIVPVMNDAEVEQLISDHYVGESQTLTTGAEQNLLKLAEMRGVMTDEEQARWTQIKEEFVRHRRMGGGADDPVSRVTGTLSGLSEDLTGIKQVLEEGTNRGLDAQLASVGEQLGAIKDALAAGDPGEVGKAVGRVGRYLHQIKSLMDNGGGDSLGSKIDVVGLRLDGIREALWAFQEEPEPSEADTEASPRVGRARRLAGDEQWMMPYLLRIEAALEALGTPRIEVHSSAEVQQLLQQQRQLIESTLVPLVQTLVQKQGG